MVLSATNEPQATSWSSPTTVKDSNPAYRPSGVRIVEGNPRATLRDARGQEPRSRGQEVALLETWDGQMGLYDENPTREVSRERLVVVFDLETQRSFAEVGGRTQLHRLGVSIGVAYRYDRDEFLTYDEDSVSDLVDLLCEADLVVGYNIKGFDYEVLRGYTDRDLQKLPSFDIMFDLERRLGFRPKLDSVSQATLGGGKSADGLQALEWWKSGEIEKIAEYCREDVRVTRDLYDFGKRNRFVHVSRFTGKPARVEVDW